MPDSHPTATLFGTHTRKLSSTIIGQEYEISVWLPPDYADSPDKNYPVMYVLDGDILFGPAAHIGWMLVMGEDTPPMIIVGIGCGMKSMDDWRAHRRRDFCPVAIESFAGSKEGGAADFLTFIETELMPFVNANYRTDRDNQNIWGASLGGLFVLYALLQRPGLFRGIVAGCPALWAWADGMNALEEQFAQNRNSLPVRLYIAVGELESPEGVKFVETFYHKLASRNYEGLTLTYGVLDGETHYSSVARQFITGIREIFKS